MQTVVERSAALDVHKASVTACVRLPGERGLHRYREQLAHGVALYPTIMPALAEWAERYDVPMPVAA